jgi:hypothetical protein
MLNTLNGHASYRVYLKDVGVRPDLSLGSSLSLMYIMNNCE